jgi:DNA gyrase subunit A
MIPIEDSTIATAELGDVLKEYFGIYVKYVAEDRAIPDVRDGLKPVHRRLVYAAYDMGARAPNKMMKSAKPVAECMGNYHPHGDQSIYDSLVRMTQNFSMRIPLFDAQGNFGSIDGDSAAAMRYTETRLNKIAQEIFCNNLNKEVVKFVPNYDESTTEPSVLPAELPHILLNCNAGIAVGVATDIISCAPRELIDCLIAEIDENLITNSVEKPPRQFRGLDLPTGGIIEFNKEQLTKLWTKGNSNWNVRGEAVFETDESSGTKKVIVTSLPYQQQKDKLLMEIAKLITQKQDDGKKSIEGIIDMGDESSEEVGIRMVFTLAPSANPDVVLNLLYKKSKLQKTLNTNTVALVNGKPKYLGVREILLHWLDFRRECVYKILEKEKAEKEIRLEIVDGLLKVHVDIDKTIKIIRNAENAKEALMEKMSLTLRQASSVVEMRLGSLRKIDQGKLKEEKKSLADRIAEIINTLKDPKEIDSLIHERLKWWRENTDPRRTKIVKEFGEITTLDTIIEQNVMVSINSDDKVKLTDVHSYRKTRRGGTGVKEASAKDESVPRLVAQVTTHDMLYAFTDKSRVFEKPCHELPITKRRGRGFAVTELFPGLEKDEKIVDIISMNVTDMDDDASVVMIRSNGNVKRMACKALIKKRGRLNGEECCRCDLDDSKLLKVTLADAATDLIMFTKNGSYRRISVNTLRPLPSRASGGNKCFILTGDDKVIGVDSVGKEDAVVSVSELGYGAKFKEEVLPFKKGRVGKGIKLANSDAKSGDIVYGGVLKEGEELFLTTSGGKSLRTSIDGIREVGRGSRGVRMQKLGKDETIVAVTKITMD